MLGSLADIMLGWLIVKGNIFWHKTAIKLHFLKGCPPKLLTKNEVNEDDLSFNFKIRLLCKTHVRVRG